MTEIRVNPISLPIFLTEISRSPVSYLTRSTTLESVRYGAYTAASASDGDLGLLRFMYVHPVRSPIADEVRHE
jgi:hypothetical protein